MRDDTKSELLEIDGAQGEGGGQILRSALSLSLVTGRAFRIVNVRARRANPGLRPQHLLSVEAAARIGGAEVEGASLGSREVRFRPKAVRAGDHTLEVGTAGAVSLVFQTLFVPLALASGPSRLVLRGGTHVPASPPFEYLEGVFLEAAARMGMRAELRLERAGWYPGGGGEIVAAVLPAGAGGLRAVELERRGPLRQLAVIAVISNLPSHIAERECDRASRLLASALGARPRTEVRRLPAPTPGTLVAIVARFDDAVAGFSALGRIGKPAEKVAEEAVSAFLAFEESGAAVDPNLADQLLIPMALASGPSRIVTSALTEHARTNMWLVERFLPVRFEVEQRPGGCAAIAVAMPPAPA